MRQNLLKDNDMAFSIYDPPVIDPVTQVLVNGAVEAKPAADQGKSLEEVLQVITSASVASFRN